MAKAKKTPPTGDPVQSPAPATATKKAPTAKAKKPAAAPPSSPIVDTVLAAQAAAKQLVAGVAPPSTTATSGKESASFKQLKAGLANPASGLDSMLDRTAAPGGRKPNTPFGGPKSTGGLSGRNQTFGADVNRSGVPRRTSGG